MTMTSGTRVDHYEIIGPAGSGGMGDVYRARDVRLDRDVAVKTLKGAFTERFEREAHAISALNHPNICTLYDIGHHDGSGYLVMEFIEGTPIAGPLPVEQAVTYGIQICEALHAAHRKGIVHRDLKPANILVTKQGIKLLDFGLAKLAATSSVAAAAAGAVEQATVAALTGTHTVVGTPQFMAPEQIEAREVDARTDIFAFGCVLYELLTGTRAFDGQTSSSVMAAVLATTPRPIEELIPLTPPALDRIVSRCLAKDPEDRWQSARDVAAELSWVLQGGSKAGLPAIVSGRRRVREKLAWAACGLASVAAIAFAVAWVRRAPQPAPIVRFPLTLPAAVQNASPPVISPDGRNIVFAADSGGQRMLWLRPMDSIEVRPLPGTEGVFRPFWSPDSRFVGFIAAGKMKKVAVAGGPPQTICDVSGDGDGSWSPEGVILFDGLATDPLREVSAAGGVSKPFVFEAGKTGGLVGSGWPEFLPDGKHFLYTVAGAGATGADVGGDMALNVGLLGSTTSKTLFRTTTRVAYAAPGYLLFVREQTLVAQKFDPDTQTLSGDPVPLGEGLGTDTVGLASFSVSRTGVLVYRGGELTGSRLVWIDRNGKETPAMDAPADYHDTWLSPDRTHLVYDVGTDGGKDDVWIRDLTRGVSSRFTFGPTTNVDAIWSPDGRSIVYTSRAKGPGDLYSKDASGTKDPEALLVDPDQKYVSDWSPDGKYLLYTVRGKDVAGWDIRALPMQGDRKSIPIVATRFSELWATFSPDGQYIAYQSNESGRAEIYVQEFPQPRHKWQISTNGGVEPYWSRDGKELFYRAGRNIMAVPVTLGASFVAGTPAALFETRFSASVARGVYRPSADGQRFLVLAPRATQGDQPASVVLNWMSGLRN
ncbi:MAG TPA: protein kinase [Vicinamibacterales bacterium]|nr:protein kinase [Vicinamibacterales bacterium]